MSHLLRDIKEKKSSSPSEDIFQHLGKKLCKKDTKATVNYI